MSVFPKPELVDGWLPLRRGDGEQLDVDGSRLTIRPFFGRGGFALRVNGDYIATFKTIELAKAKAAAIARKRYAARRNR